MTEEETSPPTEQSVPESAPADPRALIIDFIKELRVLLPKAELERNFWVTKTGLFIRVEFQPELIKTFTDWFEKQHQIRLPEEKVVRKLFDSEKPAEFYLLVGSSVTVGNVVPCGNNQLRGASIRLYEGVPLDTTTTIHQTDPIFSVSDKLSAKLTRQGYAAQIRTKQGEFLIPFDKVAELRSYFSLNREKHIRAENARHFLETLSKSLDFAKLLSLQSSVIFPQHYTRGYTFLTLGNSVLVTDAERIIVGAFAFQGRGFEPFVRDELLILSHETRQRRIAGATVSVVKGSFLAHYDVMGIRHTFGVSAFLSFLRAVHEYALRNGKLPGKLKNHTTVRDILPEITQLLRDAQPCLPEKIPAKIRDDILRAGTGLVAKGGEWFFAVDRAKMIREIVYHQKQESKPLEIIHPVKNL